MNRDLSLSFEVRPAGAVEESRELGQAIAVAPERDVGQLLVQFIGKRQLQKRTGRESLAEELFGQLGRQLERKATRGEDDATRLQTRLGVTVHRLKRAHRALESLGMSSTLAI